MWFLYNYQKETLSNLEKRQYLLHYGSDKGFKGTAVNLSLSSLHGGSLEITLNLPNTEFKEFEPRLKCKLRLKYGCFHLKSYSSFQDLSRRSIKTSFWRFSTRIKFIKFGQCNIFLSH